MLAHVQSMSMSMLSVNTREGQTFGTMVDISYMVLFTPQQVAALKIEVC